MRIDDIFENYKNDREILLLKDNCSQFLTDSNYLPLYKNLSQQYDDFQKVKVRKKNESNNFTETFNEAFETQHPGLRQRAIFANGESSFKPTMANNAEPFYIFPINGYKFMYSKEVQNSGSEYKQVFETLFTQFGEEKGNEVLTDLLRFTYTSSCLKEGIETGSEIIIYGIPYYYAVRVSSVDSYDDLISRMTL